MRTEPRGTAIVTLTYRTGEEEQRRFTHITYNDAMKEASHITIREHNMESVDVDFLPISNAVDVLHPA